MGALVPEYIFDVGLNAPATPSSLETGDPTNTKGPAKSEIDPDAIKTSPFLVVVAFTLSIEPLLCLII